ncbi:Polysaccharide biosynthesis C-terminal domain-containing protein [Butyrivibrio proteoclasticus]|uniref:Polysaccharide biosynthesis C-terminal domain-containing protein n=1 Tax=Butyrivibrio proteoclasticus TaxID=43305 RepID=A0A1I5QEV1_9FIRM|nr:polysaccharide biosynthesis C-terminal domain-containing protein [Butyrivibrio proteoclasticus]SFP44667.1 Polysaccharide biosynthesis C-terminal domain-containing protein [Butyrivibrio proteoclasticus]
MKQYFEEKRIRPDVITALFFFSVLLMMTYEIITIRIYGDKGSGFVAGPMAIFYMLYLAFVIAVQKSVWIMVRLRARRSQYLNAETNMVRSFRIFVVCGVLSFAVLFVSSYYCSEYLFGSKRSLFQCIIVAVCALFMSIQGVLRGYLQGLGYTKPIVISDVLIAVCALVSGTIISAVLYNYGLKVNNLFHVNELSSVYGSTGMMIGILIGIIVGFIQIVVSFSLRKNEIKEIVKQGAPRYLDNKNDVLITIRSIILLYITPALVILFDIVFYVIHQKHIGSESDYVLNYGVYAGRVLNLISIFVIICIIPFIKMWNMIMARIERDEVTGAKDRLKALSHSFFALSVPIMIFIFVMAKTIEVAVFGKNNDLSNYLIEMGSLLVVFAPIAVFFSWLLNHIGKVILSLVSIMLSWILHVVMMVALVVIAEMGAYGVLISLILSFVLYDLVCYFILSKMLRYRQEIIRTLGVPLLCSALSGLLAFIINVIFLNLIGDILTLVIAFILYSVLYIVLMIIFRGLTAKEISRLPFGSIFMILAGNIGVQKNFED